MISNLLSSVTRSIEHLLLLIELILVGVSLPFELVYVLIMLLLVLISIQVPKISNDLGARDLSQLRRLSISLQVEHAPISVYESGILM